MRVASVFTVSSDRPRSMRAPVRSVRMAFYLSARVRFWLHFVASGLSCVLFFGGIVALLWGAA